MANQPLISVIITSFSLDRLEDIYGVLDAIKTQSYPNIETIFIAERSRELFDRVSSYTEEKAIPKAKVIFNDDEPGMSAARNVGIRNAVGDIIAFVDDDTLPFDDWVEEMVKTYDDDSIIAVTGPAVPLWENESMSWYPEEFYWIIGCTAWCHWDKPREVRNIWGMNMSFRKEAFEAAGLFSTDIGGIQGQRLHGEEDEMSLRVKQVTKKRIFYNPRGKVRHKVYKYRMSASFVARSSYWIGYTRNVLEALYSERNGGEKFLSIEHQLLKRIFTRFFPVMLGEFFYRPVVAGRKLSLAVVSLFFVALGYFISYLHGIFNREYTIFS